MLKVAEVAVLLRVCERTVYRLLKRGELKKVKVGSALRIPQEAVDAYLAQDFIAA